MKTACPRCGAAHQIDDGRVPDAGAQAKCRSCGHAMFIKKPAPQPEQVTCPKCNHAQPQAEACVYCGVIMARYRAQADAARPLPAKPAAPVPAHKADTVGSLFAGLFDLSFSRMVTPGLIRAVYGAFAILGGIAAVCFAGYLFFARKWFVCGQVILSYFFLLIIARQISEFQIIAFKIEENVRVFRAEIGGDASSKKV